MPVLLGTGLIESSDVDWLRDPDRDRYLKAPLSPYPIKAQVTSLPYFNSGAQPGPLAAYEADVVREVSGASRFLVICTNVEAFERSLQAQKLPELRKEVLFEGNPAVIQFERLQEARR
jgi:hypothetical protein